MTSYISGKKISNTAKDAKNLAEYIVSRLVDLGITHAFSIPGDFSFPIDRALVNHPEVIFLDEATRGVDTKTQNEFYKLLQKLIK